MKTKQLTIFVMLLLISAASSLYAQKQITVLHTSDTHSRIEPIDVNVNDPYAGMGGYLRRVAMIKQLREENPGLLLFDCGDFSQGTPYYNMFKGDVEIRMMNLMKYDAVLIGNHEFDFGMENLARLCREADFPIISSNYNVEFTVLNGLVKPYVTFEREGVKIGVLGISAALIGLVQTASCEGVIYEEPIPTANRVAAFLKEQEKCDIVICLSHLGITDDEYFINQTANIDVVLGGHSHSLTPEPRYYMNANGKQVMLMHTGKNGIFVGEVTLTVE